MKKIFGHRICCVILLLTTFSELHSQISQRESFNLNDITTLVNSDDLKKKSWRNAFSDNGYSKTSLSFDTLYRLSCIQIEESEKLEMRYVDYFDDYFLETIDIYDIKPSEIEVSIVLSARIEKRFYKDKRTITEFEFENGDAVPVFNEVKSSLNTPHAITEVIARYYANEPMMVDSFVITTQLFADQRPKSKEVRCCALAHLKPFIRRSYLDTSDYRWLYTYSDTNFIYSFNYSDSTFSISRASRASDCYNDGLVYFELFINSTTNEIDYFVQSMHSFKRVKLIVYDGFLVRETDGKRDFISYHPGTRLPKYILNEIKPSEFIEITFSYW